MARLEETTMDPLKEFGAIYQDLQTLSFLMNKVIDYFDAKEDQLGDLVSEKPASHITPLFKSMQEPSELNVGQLIDLKCGHTQRPTDLETVMFTVHLQAAGFMAGLGNIGSPQRSINV